MTIPFALDPLGRLVDARALQKHAQGPFRCAACRCPVILRQGEIKVWHFAHLADANCARGFETALHLLAKQILLEHRHLRAPALVCVDESSLGEDITLCNEHVIRWAATGEAEKWMDGIRPDFVADCGNQLLIVEVVVTHEPDNDKLVQLDRLAMPALEIDLSDVARDVTVDALTHRILDTVAAKRWLFYPGWAEAQAQLDARLAEEEAEFAAEHARERAQERREHDLARRERAAELARQAAGRRKREAAYERFRQALEAEKQAFVAWKLGLAEREWPPVFGSPVRGAASVPALARTWQADVFRKFIQGQRSLRSAPALSVEVVAEWLTERYAVLPAASTSLRVAVWDFLSLLETHGYLRRRVRQEFEILKDALLAPGEFEPTHALHPAAAATRGLFWSHNYVDQEQLHLAAEQTGVRLPHDVMRRMRGRHSAAGAPLSEAEYTHSVSVALRLPLGQTVEFLVAAGFFVRV
ncbi:competence protein CoiA family protein [Burkholderia sp. Bp8991]|uniref:competence protein CoiA family protein n=1 Tax=Burkholderia sp. Bp8991 TaxID=2184553 RepID=UPI00163B5168|nr:competence protein CoiA family protein [Burkholderia sp. Bp8991]